MSLLDVLLVGASLAILGFVGFSLKKQYRYATQIFDMIRVYPILTIVLFTGFFIRGLLTEIPISDTMLLVSPFILVLDLILFYYSLDWYSDYTLTAFRDFMESLVSDEFTIISYQDYESGNVDSKKVNVFLRHDVDISLSRTMKMADIQKELGVYSTYFFRLHAERYYFEDAIPLIENISDQGFGIGLHYETLSLAKGDKQKALELLTSDIERLREFAPVNVVAAHGQKGYKNQDIWEDVDKEALQISSAYDMKYDLYLSDAGGKRLRGKDGKYLFDRIYEAKPGQIVQILIHPDWWN
jgi:hypothetical protein